MESILLTIKSLLGISKEYDGYDLDIILAINTAFTTLTQLGIGPSGGYSIGSLDDKWVDFFGDVPNAPAMEAIKSYIYLKSRLLFDPPGNSFLVNAIDNQLSQLEWRLQVLNETTLT